MSTSKVHSCLFQEMVAMGKQEPIKHKPCRCREFVTYEEANEMVKYGEALWVVIGRERGVQEKACAFCYGGEPIESCELCKGSGRMNVPVEWDTYNQDIVRVNHRTKSNKISTPRVPTIESEHIERAYVEGNEAAAKRIEDYGRSTQQQIREYGAALSVRITRKEVGSPKALEDRQVHQGVPEPENKAKGFPPGTITFKDGSKNKTWYWKHEGRETEYGRTV